jgi:hypothetical protein
MSYKTYCIIAPKIAESQDRIRLWKQGVRDLMMELCCALHTFRVRLTPWQPMIESGETQWPLLTAREPSPGNAPPIAEHGAL